jgi:glycosyltransferase involved in cell wall biosynthesis
MKIAIIGTRGIPANYSGLEACVEETGVRLAERGHDVTVYCRINRRQEQMEWYKGVRLIWLPELQSKHGATISHTSLSVLHLLRSGQRPIVHVYGVGNAPFLSILRGLGYATLVSVDGQDWRRAKWGRVASAYLRACAGLAARTARFCIVDSQVVEAYYRATFGVPTVRYVPYGVTLDQQRDTPGVFARLGIDRDNYALFVGRVVPEKGVHYLLEAYQMLETDTKLVIVGATQDAAYDAELRRIAPPSTVFAGPIYGDEAATLYRHARLYVHPSDVDGTSHALLSAMGSGRTVLVSDIPENTETVGGAGFRFRQGDVADLARKLCLLTEQPLLLQQAGRAAQQRITRCYNWNTVTDQLEAMYAACETGSQ